MYRVRLLGRAERGLRRIQQGDPRGFDRIASAIRGLSEDPRPSGAIRLKGFTPPAWRLRVGEYRIVYEIHEANVLVIVINIAPRGEVYR